MKKFIASLLLAAVMIVSFTGCGKTGSVSNSKSNDVYPDDEGYAEGRMGDIMHNYFFDYTVNSAYLCDSYGTWEAAEGYKVLVAEVTIKNTSQASIPMYDTDFQIQWSDTSNEAYDWPLTYYAGATETIGENVLPAEYTLSVNESRTGLLLYEIPENETDFSISYMEYFDDDSTGDVFFVFFSAKEQ